MSAPDEVQKVTGLSIGEPSYGIFFPADGYLVWGLTENEAQDCVRESHEIAGEDTTSDHYGARAVTGEINYADA